MRRLVLFVLAALPALAQTPPVEEFYGSIETGASFHEARQIFDSMDQAGLRSIRTAIFWNYLEPDRYNHSASRIGWTLHLAGERSMRVHAILMAPNRAREIGWTPPHIDPDVRRTFLKYVEEMALLYGDRVDDWELLNEVNQGDGDISVHYPGRAYATLAREARQAIERGYRRGGHAVDFRLWASGTAGSDPLWIENVCLGLEDLYRAHPGEGKYLDGFSIHPFSAPHGPDVPHVFDSPAFPHHRIGHGTLLQNIDVVRLALGRHPSVPNRLWIGEYGWSTSHPANPAMQVTEHEQARYVAQGFLEAHASGAIEQVVWAWTFRDFAHGTWDFWDHTGAVAEDGRPKPAFHALANLIDRLRATERLQDLGWTLPDGRAYLYGAADRQILVAWNGHPVARQVRVSAGSRVRRIDLLGRLVERYPAGTTQLTLPVVADPTYLVVDGGRLTALGPVVLDAGGRPVDPGRRVPTRWSRASSSAPGTTPAAAFDTRPETIWNAGAFAPAWIEVRLYRSQTVDAIVLEPAQSPAGRTVHEIQFSIDQGPYRTVARFEGHTTGDSRIVLHLPRHRNVTHVRVRTLSSPSWVAWREISAHERR